MKITMNKEIYQPPICESIIVRMEKNMLISGSDSTSTSVKTVFGDDKIEDGGNL